MIFENGTGVHGQLFYFGAQRLWSNRRCRSWCLRRGRGRSDPSVDGGNGNACKDGEYRANSRLPDSLLIPLLIFLVFWLLGLRLFVFGLLVLVIAHGDSSLSILRHVSHLRLGERLAGQRGRLLFT